ncbi:MAG: ATP-binding cassette domain-containing protein [Nitrososphaerota archaeon]|nr:ATP-binding cassette domain-containing protein [Candidatus Calditenuaceae archaeon]MDW8073241.1 ATP-binding cassette domain-containing protein [Nitrososphaerota archaeon]
MVLEVRDLVVSKGGFRLEIKYLQVTRKTVLLGRNGAGKSTLLRCLMGFIRQVSGLILVEGRDISQLPPEERPLGYIPQRVVKLPLAPKQQLEFFSRLHCGDYRPLVSKLGLSSLVDKKNLSLGEAQLLTIATTLLKNPSALLMDEPCANLDWPTKRLVLETVRNIDVPVLYVTHDPLEALMIADEVALLENGILKEVYPNNAREDMSGVFELYDLYKRLKPS